MLYTDFTHQLSDAMQWHEGYGRALPDGSYAPTAAFNNANPGNLKFVGQAGAILGNGGFANFQGNFQNGKAAQLAQLDLDLKKFDTLDALVAHYAPAFENDVPAYVNAIVQFFALRNLTITGSESIKAFIANTKKPCGVIIVNQLFGMADWHSIQQAISKLATYMPQYTFSVRYSSVGVRNSVQVVHTDNPPGGQYSGLSATATKSIIAPYANGNILFCVVYDGGVLQGYPSPYGGCEFGGMSVAPASAVCSATYMGQAFTEDLARVIFHEFIHGLFKVTGQADILHQYLGAHGGYAQNVEEDLLAVYNGTALNNELAILNLLSIEAKVVAQLANQH